VFISDVSELGGGEQTSLTAYIQNVRKFSTHIAVRVKDITGSILVQLIRPTDENEEPCGIEIPDGGLRRGTRVRITGEVAINADGERLIDHISKFEVMGSVSDRLVDLDAEMHEQASRMLMSRVCNYASQFLRRQSFVEFDARVISTGWLPDGLEPLSVVYPGFGSPMTLSTSPAAQVLDFMTTTGANRAYTVSTSFSTTYRFPNGSAEARVVVGKATDLDPKEHEALLCDLAAWILERLAGRQGPADRPQTTEGEMAGEAFSALYPGLTVRTDLAARPAWSDPGGSPLESMTQIVNRDGSPLVEGSRERLGNHLIMAGFTAYPAQFLEHLQKTPTRQLRDLRRFRVWDT